MWRGQRRGISSMRSKALLVVLIARPARQPVVGGAADARCLAAGNRSLGGLGRQAALHLDEGEAPAAHSDDVDLARPPRVFTLRPRMR